MVGTSKFTNPFKTIDNKPRAWVDFLNLKTLWLNTGTLCNLSCSGCYIESSPKNDSLSFLNLNDIIPYINEIKAKSYSVDLIGLTGGEPFLNPNIIGILKYLLSNNFEVLVLTNALRLINRHFKNLLELNTNYGPKLKIRVSLDHYKKKIHEKERGPNTFNNTLTNIQLLYLNSFALTIAGRYLNEESVEEIKDGYYQLLTKYNIKWTRSEFEKKIVLFPEMSKKNINTPEITTKCWQILNRDPKSLMCSSERMIIKRKGQSRPVIVPCTLLPYEEKLELGTTIESSQQRVYLNHPFCSQFCVLGGQNCSSIK